MVNSIRKQDYDFREKLKKEGKLFETILKETKERWQPNTSTP